jgi:hypothetical protein
MENKENPMSNFRNYKLIKENPETKALKAEELMDKWDAEIDRIDDEIRRLVHKAEVMEQRWDIAQEKMDEEDWDWVILNLGNPDAMV